MPPWRRVSQMPRIALPHHLSGPRPTAGPLTWILGGLLLVPVVIIVGVLTLLVVPALAGRQALAQRSRARPAATAAPTGADAPAELRAPVTQQPGLAGRAA